MIPYLFLIVGFVLLLKGAQLLVDGASAFAKRYGISSLVIGLTIVAFGTSAPELVVNILAGFRGATGLAIGNVVGSNIVNTFLILGITAFLVPVTVKRSTVWNEIPLSLLAVFVLVILAFDTYFDFGVASAGDVLSRGDGLILLAFFLIFMRYVLSIAQDDTNVASMVEKMSTSRSFWYVLVGFTGLAVGGHWIVNGATDIAQSLGVSDTVIGLTIVAIGTSLPELATSAVAAWKKQADMAVGNIIGSNIFNIFWILGVSATITAIPFSRDVFFDVLVLILSAIVVFIFLFVGERHVLHRWQGGFLVLFYVLYIVSLIVRQ